MIDFVITELGITRQELKRLLKEERKEKEKREREELEKWARYVPYKVPYKRAE